MARSKRYSETAAASVGLVVVVVEAGHVLWK